jgi:hypothetical protein
MRAPKPRDLAIQPGFPLSNEQYYVGLQLFHAEAETLAHLETTRILGGDPYTVDIEQPSFIWQSLHNGRFNLSFEFQRG